MCVNVYGGRHLVKAMGVTAGLTESSGSLLLGGWLDVTCRLTACTPGLAPGPMLARTSIFFYQNEGAICMWSIL